MRITDPSLVLSSEMMILYGEIMFELGKLSEMTKRLPDVQRFMKAYVIKDALLLFALDASRTEVDFERWLTSDIKGIKQSCIDIQNRCFKNCNARIVAHMFLMFFRDHLLTLSKSISRCMFLWIHKKEGKIIEVDK